jgi:pyrimidine operon attenuation protein / uracil phosphoribosyltransferase
MKTTILNNTQIERILKRIAYQIIEQCFEEKSIILVGVKPRGVWVAEQLKASLNQISNIEVSLFFVTAEIQEDFEKEQPAIENNCVILVDDILNSGTTMMLAASRLALKRPSRLLTACLVDRKHRKFPVQSDFTGMSLATTIQEHLTLDIEAGPIIYLN